MIQRRAFQPVVIVAMALVCGIARADEPSIFPDKNLEAAVRKQVYDKRNNDQPITAEDVAHVSVIEGKGMGIKDLTGIGHCRALASLDLTDNEISDLTPLKELTTLQSVTLAKNRIADLSPLAKLKGLQYLNLTGNRIEDLGPMVGLTKLNSLYLGDNRIKDITPLQGLEKLWSLYLAGNPLEKEKAGALGKLGRVSTLDLSGCGLSDLSILGGMNSLNLVLLENNKIADLSPLVEMVHKDATGDQRFAPFLRLYLKGNPLSEQAKTQEVSALKADGVKVSLE